ncbi:MAG: hypothetical protein WC700_02015 [Gemmatimonadaceae bacterium]
MYQSHGQQLAPAPAPSVGPFGQSVRNAVRVARLAKDLTPPERQLLDDLSRTEERYQYRTLERLTAILARVPDETLRENFAEDVRAAICAHGGGSSLPSLREAIQAETEAVADADVPELHVAMLEVALNGQAPIELLERAAEKMRRQAIVSRNLFAVLSSLRFHRLRRGHA